MTRMLRVCWLLLAMSTACADEAPPRAEAEVLRPERDASEAGARDAAPTMSERDASVAFVPDAQRDVAADAAGFDAAPPNLERDAAAPDAQAAIAATRAPLVVPERWLILDAGADPFDDRPAAVDCSTAGVVAETLSDERVLGVETGWCNYLSALQPTQRAVQPGEVIKVRLWHFQLSAPEPAEAHAALHVGDLRVLDERIAIPQAGGLIVKQIAAESAIPAGTPVHFHLHNHGANSWALVEVSTGPGS